MLSIHTCETIHVIGFCMCKSSHPGLRLFLVAAPCWSPTLISFILFLLYYLFHSSNAMLINWRHHFESASDFDPLRNLRWNFEQSVVYFQISTFRIPKVHLLLLNYPHKIRVQWYLGYISYCVSPVGLKIEIMIFVAGIISNSSFLF